MPYVAWWAIETTAAGGASRSSTAARAVGLDGAAWCVTSLSAPGGPPRPPAKGWLAWRLSARFGVGVTGIVRAADGRVLLLRHRLWPDDTQWGFPSGFAKRGERFQDTVVREVREETGLIRRVGRLGLAELRSGLQCTASRCAHEAALTGGLDGLVLDGGEILDARLFPLDALPAAMPPLHRELARRR